MCCNTLEPVVAARALFRDATGLNIPQNEWHALRRAAEARLRAEGLLEPGKRLTNGRADAALVVAAATRFASTLDVSKETADSFIARLSHVGMSVGNAHTLNEVSDRIEAGIPVGVKAQQQKNGKDRTETDMLDVAGAYTTPTTRPAVDDESGKAPYVMPKRVSANAMAFLTSQALAVDPEPTAGQRIVAALEPLLKEFGAHGGKVTPTGTLFELGERTDHGLVVVVAAAKGDLVTVTIGRWKNAQTSDIVVRREKVSMLDAQLTIRSVAETLTVPQRAEAS